MIFYSLFWKNNLAIILKKNQTGGGKPEYIPPDDALEKVASMLGSTCDGYSVEFGGDAEVEVTKNVELVKEPTIVIPFEDIQNTPSASSDKAENAESSSLRTPQNRKFFFSSTGSKGNIPHK